MPTFLSEAGRSVVPSLSLLFLGILVSSFPCSMERMRAYMYKAVFPSLVFKVKIVFLLINWTQLVWKFFDSMKYKRKNGHGI